MTHSVEEDQQISHSQVTFSKFFENSLAMRSDVRIG